MTFKRMLSGTVLVSLVAGTACGGGDSTGPDNPDPGSLSVSVPVAVLSLAQGANGTVTVTVGRTGNFAGAVAVAVEGLPSNVTATATPATVAAGATTTTLNFTAAMAAPVGNSTVTIRASGAGVAEKTATLTLTVTAAAPQGGYTFALSPATLTLEQGAQGTSTATLTRTGGYAGNVAFSATGAPTGMTVTFTPTTTTGTATSVGVAVASTVAPNTYPVTIRGTAAGLAEQVATLSVTVTSASPGGNTTYRFCSDVPVFAATQDGSGAWTVRTVANGRVTFDVASGKGGVAYVTSSGANAYNTVIHYGTQAELNTATQCPTSGPTKDVNGSVANVAATEVAFVGLSSSLAFVVPALSNNFTLQNVPEGVTDLIAARVAQIISGTGVTQAANKAIIRRGINAAANSTLPVLDFNAAESITPVLRTFTINNLSGDAGLIQESYRTANNGTVPLYSETEGSSQGTRQVPTLPNAPSGDLHLVTVIAGLAPYTTNRSVTAWFQNGADMSFTLGPALGAVTVTAAATAPTARLRTLYTLQSQYPRGITLIYSQDSGGISRAVAVSATGGYLAGSLALDHTMPDFSALTGWNAIWGLVTGAATQWSLTAMTFTGSGGALDGVVTTSATRSGSITP